MSVQWLDQGQDDLGFELQKGREVSLLQNVQVRTGTHPASYAWGTQGAFAEGLGHEADHSSLYSAQVKNEQSCASTPPECLHGIYWDCFAIYLLCRDDCMSVLCISIITMKTLQTSVASVGSNVMCGVCRGQTLEWCEEVVFAFSAACGSSVTIPLWCTHFSAVVFSPHHQGEDTRFS